MVVDPVLIEVLRGNIVESRHHGAVAVLDADGAVVRAIGDIDQAVFPRSAVKLIQALPLVESGAAAALGLGDRELALACSSHSGESRHAALAAAMLSTVGLDETALECGAHWPLGEAAALELARAGKTPGALHNNCSGKHAGFLCTCHRLNLRGSGYVGFDHPLQALLRSVLEAVILVPHRRDNAAVDGCSIPTYAVPLRSLAHGFARLVSGVGLAADRAAAARRLAAACVAEPFYVAGTGRTCTRLLEAAGGRIFVKTGAEGVFCAAVPELGLGIALKCDDGAGRAADAAIAAVLYSLLGDGDALRPVLRSHAEASVLNRNGAVVGQVRPAGPLGFSAT